MEVDVQDPGRAERAIEIAIAHFGKLDVLVNNAAYWTVNLLKDQTPADYSRDVNVTLMGTMIMTGAVYPHMRERKTGVVINLISDSGRVGEPFLVPYGAAKAGVLGFTKGFAKESGRHGIRCNAVSPGTTHTPGAEGMIDHRGADTRWQIKSDARP